MQTSVTLEPLSWDNVEIQRLLRLHWDQFFAENSEADLNNPWRGEASPYHFFLHHEGYIDIKDIEQINRAELLCNEVHPIFDIAHWMSPTEFHMDSFFEEIQLSLRLATLLITHDDMLDWWVRLKYGRPEYDGKGRIYLKENPEEKNSNAKDQVRSDLFFLAGKIKFTWLTEPGGCVGTFYATMEDLAKSLERNVMSKPNGTRSENRFWFNPFSASPGYIIAFPLYKYYDLMETRLGDSEVEQSLRFRRLLFFTITMVHELAHALTYFWQTEVCDYRWEEPMVMSCDVFPECGKSWEKHVLGGTLGGHYDGVVRCSEVEHFYPANGESDTVIPLYGLVSDWWVVRWFQKETWNDIAANRELLYLPTITRQTDAFILGRVRNGAYQEVFYYHGKVLQQPRAPWVVEQYRQTWLKDPGLDDYFSLIPEDLIAEYKGVWKQELKQGKEAKCLPEFLENPHFYYGLVEPTQFEDVPRDDEDDNSLNEANIVPNSRRGKLPTKLKRMSPRNWDDCIRQRYTKPWWPSKAHIIGSWWPCPHKLKTVSFADLSPDSYNIVT